MMPFLERQFHLSVSGETFQIAVIVPSSNPHLVGVISSYEGSGTDSSYLSVGEGDDTLAHATRKVGRGALMVRMVSGPAVPAAPKIRAVAGLVSRVLAVALEAVNVGWERSLAFPKGTSRWRPWVLHHSSLEAVFSFTVFWVGVGGSLCCMDARDDAAGRGSGTSAKEMRDQARSDCCMRQVALHFILLLFSFELLSPQLDSLLLDSGKAEVLLSQGVDICDYPCISQMQKCVIHHGAIDCRGVKKS